MSQAQLNDLLKRMLDFGPKTTPSPPVESTDPSPLVSTFDSAAPPAPISLPAHNQSTTPPLSRQQRRAQSRIEERQKQSLKAAEKKQNRTIQMKAKLQKAKEELRKSSFSDEDRIRIERALFNK